MMTPVCIISLVGHNPDSPAKPQIRVIRHFLVPGDLCFLAYAVAPFSSACFSSPLMNMLKLALRRK